MNICETSFLETASTTVAMNKTVSNPDHVYATSLLVFDADFDTKRISITRILASCEIWAFHMKTEFKQEHFDNVEPRVGHVISDFLR